MKSIYIINAFLVDYRGKLKGDCLKIDDDKITYVGHVPRSLPNDSIIIDAKKRVVMPGVVNCHTHFYSAFSSIATCHEKKFPRILEKLWWNFDNILSKEDIYLSALVSAVDAIKSGVTCVFDHHASFSNINGSLSLITKAVSQVFLRSSMCYEVSNRHGIKKAELAIKENADFLSFCSNDCRLFNSLFGIHASFTVSNEILNEISKLVGKFDTGIHIHLLEDKIDREITQKKYKSTPVQRLSQFNLLNDKSIYAHGIYLNDNELKELSLKKCFIVHNPYSNLGNSVGMMNMSKMASKIINLGIGTDGFGNNPVLDSRLSSVIHNSMFGESGNAFENTYNALLVNNAQMASKHFKSKLGKIQENYNADIVIRDYIPQSDYFNKSEFFYKMLSAPAETVIVNGKIVRAFNKMLTINEEELAFYVNKAVKSLSKRWLKKYGG